MALLDYSIKEKCCSVDQGRGICPLFSSPPRGIWQLKSSHPGNLPCEAKKMLMPGGRPEGGGGGAGLDAAGIDWCINVEWLNKLGVKTQTALISFLSGTVQFFSCSWSDVCLFLFLLIFSAFIDQTRALHQVFLLIVCTTGVKISRIFFESDEYLFIFSFRITGVQKMISCVRILTWSTHRWFFKSILILICRKQF